MVDKHIDVVTLSNALGFFKPDITNYAKLTEEVILTEDNIKQLAGRTLASDFTHSFTEDFIDEETSEIVSLPRNYTILWQGDVLDAGLLEIVIHDPTFTEPIKMTLYKDNAENVGSFFCQFIKNHPHDIFCDDATSLLQRETSHLMLLPYLRNKRKLFRALIDACSRQSVYSIMKRHEHKLPQYQSNKFHDISPEDTIPWTALIEEFFDLKTKRVRTTNVVTPRLWKQLKEFVVARGVPDYRADQFTTAFSYLFTDFKGSFCHGPY